MSCIVVWGKSVYVYVGMLATYSKLESAMTAWRPRMYCWFEATLSSLSFSMSSSCSVIDYQDGYRNG